MAVVTLNIIDPDSAAGRALACIEAAPGCTFSEIHEAIDGRPASNNTSRATAKLVRLGVVRKVRDGKCVRHFPA